MVWPGYVRVSCVRVCLRGCVVCVCVCVLVRCVCVCVCVCLGVVCVFLRAWVHIVLDAKNRCMVSSLELGSSAHISDGAHCSCCLMCLPGQRPGLMSQPR